METSFLQKLNDIMANSATGGFQQTLQQMKTPKLPSRRQYSIEKHELVQGFPVVLPEDVDISDDASAGPGSNQDGFQAQQAGGAGSK